jgi:hypothetical protein
VVPLAFGSAFTLYRAFLWFSASPHECPCLAGARSFVPQLSKGELGQIAGFLGLWLFLVGIWKSLRVSGTQINGSKTP